MLVAIAAFGTLSTLLVLFLFKDKPEPTNVNPSNEKKEEVWPPRDKFSMKEELIMLG